MTVESELERLEALTSKQLTNVLRLLPADPSPEWVKAAISNKVKQILKQRFK